MGRVPMDRWRCLALGLVLIGAFGCGKGCRSLNASARRNRADSGKYFNAIGYEGYRDGQTPGVGPSAYPTCPQAQQNFPILLPCTHGIRTLTPTSPLHT